MARRHGAPKLYDALDAAIIELNEKPVTTSDLRRKRKILIFSDCAVDNDEMVRVCEEHEETIRHGIEDAHGQANRVREGINVAMVNPDTVANAETYIMCLVEEERTIVRPELTEGN